MRGESFPLVRKKLRGPYSNRNRHQTHLAFCRDYSAVHGAIFNLKRKGFRFPTLLFAICKAVDRVTFSQAASFPLPHSLPRHLWPYSTTGALKPTFAFMNLANSMLYLIIPHPSFTR